jgi:small subunit ribosomal protein S1
LELDQKLNVVILDFDDDKSRIQLGVKQLSPHPWDALSQDLKEGDKVKGKVSVLADYGAFIEIAEGVEGLIHVSEMSWSTHLRSAQDFVKIGDEIEAVVLTLDRNERKMSLGVKQLSNDPWTDITTKYPKGSKHTGIIRNFTNFGIFVELEEGIDGLVYISDLSWTVKVKHPSEMFSTGEKIDVLVLELDTEDRKLSLGHKQTKENPWDTYDKTFAEGTIHNGTISESSDKGSTIIFNEDVTAFVPSRHLIKEDGNKLKKGDSSDFKVIEYNKDFKRVVMSHTVLFKEEENKEFKKSQKKASKSDIDKSTLGDLDVLVDLKKKMDKE